MTTLDKVSSPASLLQSGRRERANDKRTDPATGERKRFASAILPAWARKSPRVAEATWSSLKRELVHRYRFPDRATARRAIFAWIHRNTRRRHSSLGYIPPIEWENQYRQEADQAA